MVVTRSSPAKILVGISLDAEVGNELLLWAIQVATHPKDTIVALHVLVGKELSRKIEPPKLSRTQLRRAKAFVISMLGEFAEMCQSKQVNLEARVAVSSSVERGLIDEAATMEASYLVIGCPRIRSASLKKSLKLTMYCFEHSPHGCSVLSVGLSKKTHKPLESKFANIEGVLQPNLEGSSRDLHISKAGSPFQKFFATKIRRNHSFDKNEEQHSPSQSTCEKSSPRAVLDGPEEGSPRTEEDYLSLEGSSRMESPCQTSKSRGRSIVWKRLANNIRLIFPFLASPFNGTEKMRSESFSTAERAQPSWRCFSFEEISNATNNFHPDNFVGRGGFAEVYRGDLCDGQTIAVKRLAKDITEENKQKEFLMELGIVGHICHPNTAYLIGCCIENGLHLIFKFSPNGNLATALHGSTGKSLEWSVRHTIVIGIARGLHYLHKRCKRRIIHRDIKASNVLLGPNFEPQISDFGLAKWLPKQWTHHSVIPIEGTFGYLAPEYFMHGIVDEKTDVFAFGVLVLEIITGRRPVDSSKQSLLYWAKPLLESGNIAELADPKLGHDYNQDQMRKLVLTASYCIRQSSLWRPSMSEVLQLLSDDDDSEVAESWRMPESIVDEMDDYTEDFDSRFSTNKIFQDC